MNCRTRPSVTVYIGLEHQERLNMDQGENNEFAYHQKNDILLSIDTGTEDIKNDEKLGKASESWLAGMASSNNIVAHEPQLSGGGSSNQNNTCAHCGRENVETSNLPKATDPSSSLPSQTAKLRMKETELEIINSTMDEEPAEWIFCDICRQWFHTTCVDVQQYELSLIDKYHCPSCRFGHGDSIMKLKKLPHRYNFDQTNEAFKPPQVGTEAWINKFSAEYMNFPEAPASVVRLYENGHQLRQQFHFDEHWTQPIKVISRRGLGVRMPEHDFDVLDVVKLLGGHICVDTIDVYAQQSYTMSLHRFYSLWKNNQIRERLYNILSLEFSETRLAEIVRSPTLVRELSWVRKFWPPGDDQQSGPPPPERSAIENVYEFSENPTWHKLSVPAHEQNQQHLSSHPYVELFCLMGMASSYTDFHIDFGGSSVWYHVFRGEKVFFVAPPSPANLDAFLNWWKDDKRSERFFGDLLPPGQKLYRLHVHEGETLFLPSGWIHSVYTPVDSLVFGGNFLHSLNARMQLRIYDIEIESETERRFKFPHFELCNFYAAKSIAESLKDFTASCDLAEDVLMDAAQVLSEKCAYWLKTNPKFGIFTGIQNQLQRELLRQNNLSRRIDEKTASVVANNSAIGTSVIIKSNSNMDKKHDMDSNWEELEDEEEVDAEEFIDEEDEVNRPSSSVGSLKADRNTKNKLFMKRMDIPDKFNTERGAIVEVESDGPVRLKIKLPCWHRPSTSQSLVNVSSPHVSVKQMHSKSSIPSEEDTPSVDMKMFSGRSVRGRRLRPSSRVIDLMSGSSGAEASDLDLDPDFRPTSSQFDKDFEAVKEKQGFSPARKGSKNFFAQFTPEERRKIELADHAADIDSRGELFSPLLLKKQQKRKTQKKKTVAEGQNEAGTSANLSKSGENSTSKLAAGQKRKTTAQSSREKLIKKLGMKKKR